MINELQEKIYIKKEIAIKHFNNYLSFYKENNYIKSSEFLWGTVNDLFYAIGLTYNHKLLNYTKIKDFLPILTQEYNYEEIIDQYNSAEILHSNFYHDFLDKDNFNYNKNKVIKMIEKLSEILDYRLNKLKQIK